MKKRYLILGQEWRLLSHRELLKQTKKL